ncbi:hypothetical protein BdWA1_000202 [Babesia duncani]|uniref:Uncharacterized protein n=1 Tax=Babesia duncani TaxID=323732 RepID=A0AAD9PMP0_9APIC|nr:hypothetical protein BdWA1_000202 [Babesia duncani]
MENNVNVVLGKQLDDNLETISTCDNIGEDHLELINAESSDQDQAQVHLSDIRADLNRSFLMKSRSLDFFDDLAKYILFNATDAARGLGETSTCDNRSRGFSKESIERFSSNDSDYIIPNNLPLLNSALYKSSSVDNVNRFPECTPKYVWKPGFCLQLGSQGRKAMLHLLRTTYKSNKKYKRIFENKTPPTTISNLPFFKVSMLWELANDLNVFNKAIEIHRSYGKRRNRTSMTLTSNDFQSLKSCAKEGMFYILLENIEKTTIIRIL